MSKVQIFNSPLETSMRILVILSSFRDVRSDLDRLVYIDYFLVHSSDLKDGPGSIHPPSPFRAGELAVKRDILKQGLQILHKKGLVEVSFDEGGIFYRANGSGQKIVTNWNTSYGSKLKDISSWLAGELRELSDDNFKKYISKNAQGLNVEFFKKR
jgi:hypothetical protein